MFCEYCVKEIECKAKFCKYCGAETNKENQTQNVKQRIKILFTKIRNFKIFQKEFYTNNKKPFIILSAITAILIILPMPPAKEEDVIEILKFYLANKDVDVIEILKFYLANKDVDDIDYKIISQEILKVNPQKYYSNAQIEYMIAQLPTNLKITQDHLINIIKQTPPLIDEKTFDKFMIEKEKLNSNEVLMCT